MNIELLKKVRERIADEDVFFNMSEWFTEYLENHKGQPIPCGTASCIAGHVCDILGYGNVNNAADIASGALGIDGNTATWLFFAEWKNQHLDVEEVNEEYYYVPLSQVTRKQAIRSIDWLIDGNSVIDPETGRTVRFKRDDSTV